MAHGSPNPSSPVSIKGKGMLNYPDAVPLDSSQRTKPLHPSLTTFKLPASSDDRSAALLHPVTLKPFTADDLNTHSFEALKEQYRTPEEAARAQEDAIRELTDRMEENDRKTKEIEREMEEKEKTREIERKIYKKKLGQDM